MNMSAARRTMESMALAAAGAPSAHADPGISTSLASTRHCELLGPVAVVVQLLMGVVVLGSLVYKRYKETPQRPWRVWMMDVSKQLQGQMLVHLLNVVFSSNTKTRNPCALYILNVLLDTTLGVGIIYVVMHLSQYVLSDVFELSGFESGNYRGNSTWERWSAWLRQLLVYLFSICVMKLVVVLLIDHVSFLKQFGAWLLDLFGMNRSLQVIFSMAIFPLAMNTLQFWMIDSMLRYTPQRVYVGHTLVPASDIA